MFLLFSSLVLSRNSFGDRGEKDEERNKKKSERSNPKPSWAFKKYK
jgi:hypothetical protein